LNASHNFREADRGTLLWHFTYLLTPWSRVLLEKLTGSAASQEIPRIFYGTLQNKNIGTEQVQKLLFLKTLLFGNLNYVFLDFRK